MESIVKFTLPEVNYKCSLNLRGRKRYGTLNQLLDTGICMPSTVGMPDDSNIELPEFRKSYKYSSTIDFDLDPDGEKYMAVNKIIPDVEFRDQQSTTDDVTITIKGRDYPLQDLSTLSTVSVTPNSTFTNTRARSRQCAIKVSNSSADYGWRLGDLRLDIRPDGKR